MSLKSLFDPNPTSRKRKELPLDTNVSTQLHPSLKPGAAPLDYRSPFLAALEAASSVDIEDTSRAAKRLKIGDSEPADDTPEIDDRQNDEPVIPEKPQVTRPLQNLRMS